MEVIIEIWDFIEFGIQSMLLGMVAAFLIVLGLSVDYGFLIVRKIKKVFTNAGNFLLSIGKE